MSAASLAEHAPAASWFVAQAKPSMERRATRELENQGFRAYLPCFLKRKRHARKVTVGPSLLFPGYVFVCFDPSVQRWRSINGTIGVIRLLMGTEGPAVLPQGFVEDLFANQDSQGYVVLPSCKGLSPGDKVRVVGGSFADAVGLCLELGARDRIAILLDMLGRKVRVQIDSALIEKAA